MLDLLRPVGILASVVLNIHDCGYTNLGDAAVYILYNCDPLILTE